MDILSLPYYREEKDKATQIYSHLSIQHLRTSSDNMMPWTSAWASSSAAGPYGGVSHHDPDGWHYWSWSMEALFGRSHVSSPENHWHYLLVFCLHSFSSSVCHIWWRLMSLGSERKTILNQLWLPKEVISFALLSVNFGGRSASPILARHYTWTSLWSSRLK